ncbi:MAG: hypothetical protein AAFP83_10840 [Bacteroidota bacterium]
MDNIMQKSDQPVSGAQKSRIQLAISFVMNNRQQGKVWGMCLMLMCSIHFALGQAVTGGPGQPEFTSFESAAGTNMVNPLTGDFVYTIPIVNVPGPNGGYPLAMFYRGGIRTDQVASWTGLGWGLNAGAINRAVVANPDDWNYKKKFLLSYDLIDIVEQNYLGITGGPKGPPIGLSFTWGSHQNLGLGFEFKGTSEGPFQDVPGFSINNHYDNKLKLSMFGVTANFAGSSGGGSGKILSEVLEKRTWNLYTPWVFVKYQYTKTKYWQGINKLSLQFGNLYMKDAYNFNCKNDYYTNPFSPSDFGEVENNALSFVGYDKFSMAAEGLGGNFQLNMWEEASIVKERPEYTNGSFGNQLIKNQLSLNPDEIQFSPLESNYSSPTPPTGLWSVGGSNPSVYNNPDLLVSRSGNGLVLPGDGYYNVNTNQAGSPKYIKWFTNKEIYDNYYPTFNPASSTTRDLGFMEYEDTRTRIDTLLYDPTGIGGVMVTSPSGMTYHFALPVYQHEIVTGREVDNNGNPFEKDFFVDFQRDKYATTWLLTGITGADFVDVNENGKIDDGDKGYWVKFEYGKWSDAYLWRNPYEGYATASPSGQKGTFQMGRKDVYYLDVIETETHKAYFIKDVRKDGIGSGVEVNNIDGSAAQIWSTTVLQDKDLPTCQGQDEYRYNYTLKFLFDDFEKHKLLYLKEVLVIKKEDESDFNITKTRFPSGQSGFQTGRVNYFESYEYKNFFGDWVYCANPFISYNHNFELHRYNSVIDVSDVPANIPEEKIIYRAQLNYDYSLAQHTPNSESSSGTDGGYHGRLTLKEVEVFETANTKLRPSVTFDYYNSGIYRYSSMDDWGYNAYTDAREDSYKDYEAKPNVDNWSLQKITSPKGEELVIEYESDQYAREAIIGNSNHKLRLDDQNVGGSAVSCACNFNQGGNCYVPAYVQLPTSYQGKVLDVQLFTGVVTVTSLGGSSQDYGMDINYSSVTYNAANNRVEFEACCYANYASPSCYWISAVVDMELELENFDANGGGIRVKSIVIKDEPGSATGYTTEYTYSDPVTGRSSGVTSFAPREDRDFVPYFFELPSPGVMYEYVTIEGLGKNGVSDGKKQYHFEVLDDATTPLDDKEFTLGDHFRVEDVQANVNADYSYVNNPINNNTFNPSDPLGTSVFSHDEVNLRTARIHDKSSILGKPLSMRMISPQGVTLSEMTYNYATGNFTQDGKSQETFHTANTYERITASNFPYIYVDRDWYYTTTTKVKYSDFLLSTISKTQGQQTQVSYVNREKYTHTPKSTRIASPDGEEIQMDVTHLHEITDFGEMLPRTINPDNKNILGIPAIETNGISVNGGGIQVLGSTAQRWKKNWLYLQEDGTSLNTPASTSLWQPWKQYVFKGYLNPNGTLANYQPFNQSNPTSGGWVEVSEVKQYDDYFSPLQVEDINNRASATKYGYGAFHRPLAEVFGANYDEFAFSGAEDYNSSTGYFGGGVQNIAGDVSGPHEVRTDANGDIPLALLNTRAHTGVHSIKLNMSGEEGFRFTSTLTNSKNTDGMWSERKYRASVWVMNHTRAFPASAELYYQIGSDPEVKVSPDQYTFTSDGVWHLLSIDIDLSTTSQAAGSAIKIGVRNNAGGQTLYVDDFRVHPVDVPMSARVYDHLTGQVTAMLDAENMATIYFYDEAGRIQAIHQESENGFRRVMDKEYNYGSN